MKKILFLLIISLNVLIKAQKFNRIDSLVIEMSLDPGSGPDYNIIQIHFNKNQFHIKYHLYEKFDENGYKNDSSLISLRKEYKANNEEINQSIREKINKIRNRHTKFYIKELKLKNSNYKSYISEVNHVSKISQQNVEDEKNKNASYFHGVWVRFYFYEGNKKKKLVASALEKDNFGTLYNLLIHTLNLYREKKNDENFNKKTFGY